MLRWWADVPGSSSSSSGDNGSSPELWQLETVGLLRKYLGLLDVPLAWLLGRAARLRGQACVMHVCRAPEVAWRALLAHSSQMVW